MPGEAYLQGVISPPSSLTRTTFLFPAPPDPVDAIGFDDDGIGEVALNENGEL